MTQTIPPFHAHPQEAARALIIYCQELGYQTSRQYEGAISLYIGKHGADISDVRDPAGYHLAVNKTARD